METIMTNLTIKKIYLDNPKKLSDRLGELITEHTRRANRAAKDLDADGAEADRLLNEGYRHGLNKAWKLLFGSQSFKSIKDE